MGAAVGGPVMWLWRALSAWLQPPPSDEPRRGPADPELEAAVQMLLRGGDLAPICRLLDVEPALRASRFRLLNPPPPASLLERWLERHPDDAAAWTLLAHRYLVMAWEARGGGLADEVTSRGWRGFEEGLQHALDAAMHALELAPDDPEPLTHLVTIARGAPQLGIDPRQVFATATRTDPEHLGIHLQMARLLSERWSGNPALLRAFARDCSARAAPGSALHSLVARAAIDRWTHDCFIDDDERAAMAFAADPGVRSEVTRAFEAFVAGPPSRDALEAYNAFAAWFWLADDDGPLAEALGAIGDQWLASPWDELDGDPVAAFDKARRQVGLPRA